MESSLKSSIVDSSDFSLCNDVKLNDDFYSPHNHQKSSFGKQVKYMNANNKQLLLGFSYKEEILGNNRIKLKLLNESHQNFYVDLFTDQDITQYTGGVLDKGSAQKNFKLSLEAIEKTPVDYITWVVEDSLTGNSIGLLTLVLHAEIIGCGEIGLICKKNFHGKGLGCEVVSKLIKIAFESYHLNTLVSFTLKENKCAQHILKKFNFTEYKNCVLTKPEESGIYWRLLRH